MLITTIAVLFSAVTVTALALVSFAIHLEDRTTIRHQHPAGRLIRTVRRVAGLHVCGFETTGRSGEQSTENKEVHI